METPTLCVQGIKDGISRASIEAEFEAFGRLVRVDIVPGNQRRGVPDSRIAFVEFKHKDDARKAMRSLNGRMVQGKCVAIQFARGAPGTRRTEPTVRRGMPQPLPQMSALAAKFPHKAGILAAKFKQSSRSRSRSQVQSRMRGRSQTARSRRGSGGVKRFGSSRSASRSPCGCSQSCRMSRSPDGTRRRSHSRSKSRRRSRSRSRSFGMQRRPQTDSNGWQDGSSRNIRTRPDQRQLQRDSRSASRWRASRSKGRR